MPSFIATNSCADMKKSIAEISNFSEFVGSLTEESAVASTGSSYEKRRGAFESTANYETATNCGIFSQKTAADGHFYGHTSDQYRNSSISNSEQHSSPVCLAMAIDNNRIFSPASVSMHEADPQTTVLPEPSPLKSIDLGFSNANMGNAFEHSISPLCQAVDTWPPFFEYSLEHESSIPSMHEVVNLNYFSSPKPKERADPHYENSPDMNQESSKDMAFISSILSPMVPVPMPSITPLNNTDHRKIQSGSSGTSRGKTLETILQYKNTKTKGTKAIKVTKVSKTTKRSLPIKKRGTRRRFSDDEDTDFDYHDYEDGDEDQDEDYGESDDKENRNYKRKALHNKASPCDPKADIPVMYALRSIQFYTPSDEITTLLASKNPTEVTYPVIERCKCTKSKCLKLYCDCFQAGQICTSKCDCVSCENTQKGSKSGGMRFQAIELILMRRPDAFEYRPKKTGEGCKCKKNRCLKKYCDCFNSGLQCSSRCQCDGCENLPDDVAFSNKSTHKVRRVTRHTERAQDAVEKRYVQPRIERKTRMNDFVESTIRGDESKDNAIDDSDGLLPTRNLFPSLHKDEAKLIRYGFANNVTPTNMEEI